MTGFEEIRKRHRELAQTLLPEMVAHIDWPAQHLAEFREQALRELIALCKAKSKWHQERLAHIDAETFSEADLSRIPYMTKADLMENFDAILTEPQLSLERCESHIASGETYLDDEFCVFASGGSSGVRAISVFGWEEAARNFVAGRRFTIRWAQRTGAFQGHLVQASVAAGAGAHGTQHLSRVFGGGDESTYAVTDPIHEIVEGLNRAQPEILVVYPSILPRLVSEFEEGRLQIYPKVFLAGAEPLLPEHQEAVAHAWDCPVLSSWGATEVGLLGASSGFDPGLLLYDDHAIIEPVDASGQPVDPGERADKLFVTPLFHHALPVIRYELTDQLTVIDEPLSCGSSFTRTSLIEGRLDDHFVYNGDVEVHPHVFRTVLGQNRNIQEYQVQQTERGAIIRIVSNGDLDVQALRVQVVDALKRLGLGDATIEISGVPSIERTGTATKLKRFIPLGSTSGLET